MNFSVLSRFFYFSGIVFFLVLFASCGVSKSVNHLPELSEYKTEIPERLQVNDSVFTAGSGFLAKNKSGLWELYVEGDALQLGKTTGSLTRELMHYQESVFFDKVEEFVPSRFKQYLLRKFLAWYNRKMYLHIPEEYKAEIYGLSRFASSEYGEVGTPYLRLLYLHGAHDIGHALQDLMMVDCSSFAVWGEKSADGQLLLGRNFDFYAGDEFAENKIIAFVNPDSGYKFMSVTWGGMIGVVSGMNEAGLTVTINAGKSKIPLAAKTPISIVTREILQYASSIEEAVAIAKKREVFVSEAILIGSAKDGKAAVIEMAPDNFGVFEVPNSADLLICANHFQSDAYADDPRNTKWIEESYTSYRFARMEELLEKTPGLKVPDAVSILRNQKGLQDRELGMGNEKALNQLLAHHGIVFKPESREVWVSAGPYQLGSFVYYNLEEVFKSRGESLRNPSGSDFEKNIPEDPFVFSQEFKNYEIYRVLERKVESAISEKEDIDPEVIDLLWRKNPDYWKAYFLTGKYYFRKGFERAALLSFEKALEKEVASPAEERMIKKYIRKLK